MKTSNKLLIALASSFLIIPLVAMVYENTKYVDAKDFKYTEAKPKTFSDKEEGVYAQKTETFSGVEIADGMEGDLSITFIKDAETGVKVRQSIKDNIQFSVNANGMLEVNLKNISSGNRHISIMVYGPSFNHVKVNKLQSFNVDAARDSLQLDLSNVKRFYIGNEKKIAKLTLNAENVENISFWNSTFNEVTLSLKASNFSGSSSTYEKLTINASDSSVVDFEKNNESNSAINQLILNTTGTNEVKIGNLPVKQVSGSISDATTVSMPAGYIRQMLK